MFRTSIFNDVIIFTCPEWMNVFSYCSCCREFFFSHESFSFLFPSVWNPVPCNLPHPFNSDVYFVLSYSFFLLPLSSSQLFFPSTGFGFLFCLQPGGSLLPLPCESLILCYPFHIYIIQLCFRDILYKVLSLKCRNMFQSMWVLFLVPCLFNH